MFQWPDCVPTTAEPNEGGPATTAEPNAGGPATTAGPNAGGPATTADPNAGGPATTAEPNAGGPATTSEPNAGGPATTAAPNAERPATTAEPNSGRPATTADPNAGGPATTAEPNAGGPATTSEPNAGGPATTSEPNKGGPATTAEPNVGRLATTAGLFGEAKTTPEFGATVAASGTDRNCGDCCTDGRACTRHWFCKKGCCTSRQRRADIQQVWHPLQIVLQILSPWQGGSYRDYSKKTAAPEHASALIFKDTEEYGQFVSLFSPFLFSKLFYSLSYHRSNVVVFRSYLFRCIS